MDLATLLTPYGSIKPKGPTFPFCPATLRHRAADERPKTLPDIHETA